LSASEKIESFPRIKIRIESLSDLVFGLALSIGSLELIARTPQDPTSLAVSIALFGFSFMVVVSIWIGYSRIMTIISQETGGTVSLNLLLLFCLVLEPYLFFVLYSGVSFLDWASFAYAIDVGGMFLILGGMIRLALRKKIANQDLHPILFRRFRVAMTFYALIGGTYVFSALPVFWDETPIGPLRFVFWYSAFAFWLLGVVNRRRERRMRQDHQ
jgi:uncharacterized membrane protein